MEPIKEIIKRLPVPSGTVTNQVPHERYKCEICKDYGWVYPSINGVIDYHAVPCRCQREAIRKQKIERYLKQCCLPERAEDMTLAKFEVYPTVRTAYQAAMEFAEERSSFKWLALLGDRGRGKTHLGLGIVQRWVERGRPARYAYVPQLLEELRRGYAEQGDMSYDRQFDLYLNIPLLMLDDLGTENPTRWAQEKLDFIVDYRFMHKLPMVVTSKNALDELSANIASRLQRDPGFCRVISMLGQEYSLIRRK